MFRSLFSSLTLVAVLLAAADAWTASSRASAFGGGVLITSSGAASDGAAISMKKGKPNVPQEMRGNYRRQKELADQREQMMAASKAGDDGLPVFNLFVRTPTANMWYPCGSFRGDERSAALAKSYADGGLLAGISKKQLDGGIAGSLYNDQKRLKETVARAYPQLRKSQDNLQFGYKLSFQGLSEEEAKKVQLVEPKEQKGPLDGIKNIFS